MLRDYLGKLSDADAALQGIRQQYVQSDTQAATAFDGHFYDTAEPINAVLSVDTAAQADVLDWWSSIADWTPADRTDWAAFSSGQLTLFATENNVPPQIQKAAEDWVTRLQELKGHSADFAASIGKLGSAWSGSADDAAQAALVPLWEWTSDAAGNAEWIRENLGLAGDAAARFAIWSSTRPRWPMYTTPCRSSMSLRWRRRPSTNLRRPLCRESDIRRSAPGIPPEVRLPPEQQPVIQGIPAPCSPRRRHVRKSQPREPRSRRRSRVLRT